ncbi:hypothetical protein [Brevibacillus fortis]|uniref:hypothetical protein n=1 Tax=Brevibacillus fortis TaxID=2126352 RepID=UPI0038FD0303
MTMTNEEVKGIIENYVQAYNSFDVEGIVKLLHSDIVMDNKVEVQIDYEGMLAIDLPNGFKAGDTIQLKGKSLFMMKEEKVSLIEDYS